MQVNEIFGPTLQGEGKSFKMETMFLRLAKCNLACSWCDTPWSWNYTDTPFQHPEKYDRKKEIHEMSYEEIITEIQKEEGARVKNLVISGGEPMLQQEDLIGLLKLLKAERYWVEIETNGTILPKQEFLDLIDQINCSPKMDNSGPDNKFPMRIVPKALVSYIANPKTNFKFVVQGEGDLPDIEFFVDRYEIEKTRVYLMPQAGNGRDYFLRYRMVKRLAKENKFNFSRRWHIESWGRKRGV